MADFFNPIGQTIELALNNCKQQIRKGGLKDNSPYIASSIGLLEYYRKLVGGLTAYQLINQEKIDSITPVNQAKLYCRRLPSSDPCIISQSVLLLVCDLTETEFNIINYLGYHNRKIFQSVAFKNELNHKLILPFELVTILVGSLGGVDSNYAFFNNPTHPCFYHDIRPAPVVGVAVAGNIERLIGYVASPNLLADYLNVMFQGSQTVDETKIEFDTYTALQLLKNRYGVAVSHSVFQTLQKAEHDLSRFPTGQVVLELHS